MAFDESETEGQNGSNNAYGPGQRFPPGGMDDSTFRAIIRYESPFVLDQDRAYPLAYNNTHAIFANLDDKNELRVVIARSHSVNRASFRAQGEFGLTWIGVRNYLAADKNIYLEHTRSKGGHERREASTNRQEFINGNGDQGKKLSAYQRLKSYITR